MSEVKVKRRRPPLKQRRRRAKRRKIIVIAMLLTALLCAFFAGLSSGILKRAVKGLLGDRVYAIDLMGSWSANARKAYSLMMDQKESMSSDAIAWFIQTDQHGRRVPTAKWMQHRDKTVRNISMGDVTTDYYNKAELETYRKMMDQVPNKISVYGNHDIWTKSEETADYAELARCFQSDGAIMPAEQGYFSVADPALQVKYLVISPYYINLETGNNGADITVKTSQMEWLLGEMSADDGYDIVVLMHQLFTDTYCDRSGVQQTWSDAPVILENLWEVMKDRRNKRAGTITDGEGVIHTYDFSDVKSELLCSLHGHGHSELMFTQDNMTAYAAEWLSDEYNCAFGLIDRENKVMHIWKFNRTSVLDMLTLPI